MNHKVNLQARIKRHSRILKDNLGNSLYHSHGKNFGFKLVSSLIILMFPVYPAFATLVYSNTELDIYRGNIDETSILSSYEENVNVDSDTEAMYQSDDSYLNVGVLIEDNNSSINKIISYKVKKGDTIQSIAKEYEISYNTIMWANKFGKDHLVSEGDTINFPPVTGIVYEVVAGNSIQQISKRYGIQEQKIRDQNLFTSNELKIGQKLIIPGGKYIAPPKPKPKPKTLYTKNKTVTANKKAKSYAKTTYKKQTHSKAISGRYVLRRKPKYHTFYWGQCTWFVAKYKTVNWGGNANQWLRNARAKGRATGYNPSLGSIIVFGGRTYNWRYGHVGIVMEVHKNHLIVADMNYRRAGEVTYRKISRWDKAIRGYIYGE